MTPEPTVQDETASQSDDSAGDGVQGDHADQQECEHHQGCAALPVAVSACDHNRGNAEEKRSGEEHSAGLGEPKPVTEPSPIATEPPHASSLGQRNERHLARAFTNGLRTLRRRRQGPRPRDRESECEPERGQQAKPCRLREHSAHHTLSFGVSAPSART
jgi:hypothetical protein